MLSLTSSLFVCFCRLALSVEAPASLCDVCESIAGRGMPEGLFVNGACPLDLGVPLKVPVADIMTLKQSCSRCWLSQWIADWGIPQKRFLFEGV